MNDRLRRDYAEQLKINYLKSGFSQGFEAGYSKAKEDFERPHGEWIECEEMNCHSDIEKIYICPFCKMKHHRKYDFCNCGADMRPKEGNE